MVASSSVPSNLVNWLGKKRISKTASITQVNAKNICRDIGGKLSRKRNFSQHLNTKKTTLDHLCNNNHIAYTSVRFKFLKFVHWED